MLDKKILIIGSGIAGMTILRYLKLNGFNNIKIIEKEQSSLSHGSGICLPMNAVRGMEILGLKQKLLAKSHIVKNIIYAKHNGTTLAKASLLDGSLNKQPFVALYRSQLLSILQQDLQDEICFNLDICEIRKKQNNQLSVVFNNKKEEIFDLVIGADGINSKVRSLYFNHKQLIDLNVTNWRFIAKMNSKNIDPTYFVGKDEAFMIYPISPNEVYCYAQIHDKKMKYFNSDFDILVKIFKNYAPKVQECLKQLNNCDIIKGRLRSVHSREVYKDNVVLIGDALHGCPPSLQQGVGLTLEDSIKLTDSLMRHNSIENALENFKKDRVERIDWVINESNRIIRLAGKGKFILGRIIRNIIIKKTGPANVLAWKKLDVIY